MEKKPYGGNAKPIEEDGSVKVLEDDKGQVVFLIEHPLLTKGLLPHEAKELAQMLARFAETGSDPA